MINGLPERLQLLRSKFGFSQRQLADKLSVSPSIISAYENGERTPSVENLLALSYIFNCSTDYLLGKASTQTNDVLIAKNLSHEQLHALQIIVNSMNR